MYRIVPPIANIGNTKKLTIQDMFNIGGQDNFLIGNNKMLHGGVHLKGNQTLHSVQAIADGKIIAYKLDSDYKQYNPDLKNPSITLDFSSSFVLIEHDFEYQNDIETQNIYQGYKFYSLYMHLAPKKEFYDGKSVKVGKKIPYFLSMKRNASALKKANTIISIGEKIEFGNTAIYQGDFLDAKIISKGLDLWINKKNIRFFKNDPKRMELADNLDYVFLKTESNPNQFLTTVQFDKVVDLSNNPILVKSGDLIGYLGKNIGENTKTQDGVIHFEIFCDNKNISFLENNAKFEFFSNSDLSTLVKKDSFLSGLFYKEKNSNNILNKYQELTYIGKNSINYEEFDVTTLSTKDGDLNNYPRICTDMDWLFGNKSWSKINYLEFCDLDYTANIKKIDNLKPDKKKHWLFVENHSEWAKKNIEKRYSILKSGKKLDTKIKIPQMSDEEFKKFIEYASEFCFWEEVSSLPAFDNIVTFNPIFFLERLDRCCSPFSFISSDDMFEYLHYAINNSQILVERRLNQLQTWKANQFNSSHPISKEFKKWFGYQLNIIVSPKNYVASTTVSHVANLDSAVNHVINILEKLNDFLKTIDFKIFSSAIGIEEGYRDTYAFVYPQAKLNRPIFLAYSFIIKDISFKDGIGVFNSKSTNNFAEEAVNTICHESSHFNDIGGLDDIYIIVNNVQIGPYGESQCIDIAKYHPSVSLYNSENMSFFVQGENYINEIYFS